MKLKHLWSIRTKADLSFCMVLAGFAGAFLFMAIAFGPLLIPFFLSAHPQKIHEPPHYWIVVVLAFLSFPAPMIICHFKLKPVMDRKKKLLDAFMSRFTAVTNPLDMDRAARRFMAVRATDDNTAYDTVEACDFIETTQGAVLVRLFTLDGSILESSFTSATGFSHRVSSTQKVLWIHSKQLRAPNFSIRSRRSLRRYPPPRTDLVPVPDTGFSAYYVLYGPDRDAVARLCTRELMAECLRVRAGDTFIFNHVEGSVYPELCIDGDGHDLLVFWQNKGFFEPEELAPFVQLGLRLLSLLTGEHSGNH